MKIMLCYMQEGLFSRLFGAGCCSYDDEIESWFCLFDRQYVADFKLLPTFYQCTRIRITGTEPDCFLYINVALEIMLSFVIITLECIQVYSFIL